MRTQNRIRRRSGGSARPDEVTAVYNCHGGIPQPRLGVQQGPGTRDSVDGDGRRSGTFGGYVSRDVPDALRHRRNRLGDVADQTLELGDDLGQLADCRTDDPRNCPKRRDECLQRFSDESHDLADEHGEEPEDAADDRGEHHRQGHPVLGRGLLGPQHGKVVDRLAKVPAAFDDLRVNRPQASSGKVAVGRDVVVLKGERHGVRRLARPLAVEQVELGTGHLRYLLVEHIAEGDPGIAQLENRVRVELDIVGHCPSASELLLDRSGVNHTALAVALYLGFVLHRVLLGGACV
ncbi:hypothetical protein AB0M86_45765 [Streptomyces sp. NPDC051639]|uniref:hypothetical protein n=1 Tax=Streptomyces sp. NPDC051639 TaxID=3155671 RepID=UPI003435854C